MSTTDETLAAIEAAVLEVPGVTDLYRSRPTVASAVQAVRSIATSTPETSSPVRRMRDRMAPSVITGRSVSDRGRSGTSRPERDSIEMFARTPLIQDSSAGASSRAAASSERSDAWRTRMIAARAFWQAGESSMLGSAGCMPASR